VPIVYLTVDATKATAGFEAYSRGAQLVIADSERMATAVKAMQTSMAATTKTSSTGASSGQLEQIRKETSARQQQAAAERALAADRVRAAKEMSRADAEMLAARQRAERGLLTAMSTLGAENRAMSQRIVFEQRLTAALREGLITQERASELRARANVVFSTAAVNARDLRLNMQNLSASIAELSMNSIASLAPLGRIVTMMASVRTAILASLQLSRGLSAADSLLSFFNNIITQKASIEPRLECRGFGCLPTGRQGSGRSPLRER